VQATLESHVMTAQLLPPAPLAAPVAMQSIAPPPKPTPPVHTKPKIQAKPKPTPTPTPKPTPTPLPQAAAPSPTPVAAPDPTPPAPAAPAAPPAAAAPATMEISAPKNVSHVECNIAKPDYPSLSRRRGETGTAYVKFVVGLSGKLESIELKKSSGFSRLDDAALAAVRASACKPYLENGQPVRAAYAQPFDFNLTD
jgi:protein TonB